MFHQRVVVRVKFLDLTGYLAANLNGHNRLHDTGCVYGVPKRPHIDRRSEEFTGRCLLFADGKYQDRRNQHNRDGD